MSQHSSDPLLAAGAHPPREPNDLPAPGHGTGDGLSSDTVVEPSDHPGDRAGRPADLDRTPQDEKGTDGSDPSGAGAPSAWSRVIPALALPLFFALFFPLAYVSALHAPTPHHLQLAVAGPAEATAPIVSSLIGSNPDSFDITLVETGEQAAALVSDRSVAGAIEVSSDVEVYIASGGGASQASAIQRVAAGIADNAGLQTTVVDVAPVTTSDATGTGLFYLTIVSTLVGYLTITVLSQAAPDLSLRRRLTVLGGASVVGPLLVFGVMSLFVGAYGASFTAVAGLLGTAMLYAVTCGLVTLLVNQLLGRAAIFGVLGLLVLLNFPSTGGAVPPGLLPEFWQVVHSFWVGAGALETMHSLIYFDGAQAGRWLVQLTVWTVAAAVLVASIGRRAENRRSSVTDTAAAGTAASGVAA